MVKYVTEDGEVFASEEAAFAHERIMEKQAELFSEMSRFLDLQSWPQEEKAAKRERTKAENWLQKWLKHDIRQRPERYEMAFDAPEEVDEAAVRAISGAA